MAVPEVRPRGIAEALNQDLPPVIPRPGPARAIAAAMITASFVLYANPLAGAEVSLRFQHVSLGDGLSQSMVTAIAQDTTGFMWFATQGSLNRFDGYDMRVYKPDPEDPHAIPGHLLGDALVDSRGILWLSSAEAGLVRFDERTERFETIAIFPAGKVSSEPSTAGRLFEDRRGRIWASASAGVGWYHPGTGQMGILPGPEEGGLPSGRVTCTVEAHGLLWFGTSAGLCRVDPETLEILRIDRPGRVNPAGPDTGSITALHLDGQGTLWIGTNGDGFLRYDRASDTYVSYFEPGWDGTDAVTDFTEGPDGRLWGATAGAGIFAFDRTGEVIVRYVHDRENPRSLSHDFALSLFVDRTGSLWIGTNGGGVCRANLATRSFGLYQRSEADLASLPAEMVMRFEETADGRIWISTHGAGPVVFNPRDRTFARFRYPPGHQPDVSDDVNAIREDAHGRLWIASPRRGLDVYDPATGGVERYRMSDEPGAFPASGAFDLLEDRQGRMWVATEEGLLSFDQETRSLHAFPASPRHPDGLDAPAVLSLFEDSRANLWIGTRAGLYRRDGRTQRMHSFELSGLESDGPSEGSVVDIHEDATGTIWVCHHGAGVTRLTPDVSTLTGYRATHYTTEHGLPHDVVHGAASDLQGRIWFSTNLGLSRLDPRTETFRNFNAEDGLQSNRFNRGAVLTASNGMLAFGGLAGMNYFDPLSLSFNATAPPVVLTGFRVLNEDRALGAPLHLARRLRVAHDENLVSFTFAALDYSSPKENRYAYRLVGVRDAWVSLGHERTLTYAGLDPGRYRLQVRASSDDGVWNPEPIEIEFQVIPPWWRTGWAYLAAGLILAGAALRYQRAQATRLRRERATFVHIQSLNDRLEEKVLEHRRAEKLIEGILSFTSVEAGEIALHPAPAPTPAPAASPAPPASAVEAPGGRNGADGPVRVLLVEDNAVNQLVIRKLVERYGMVTDTADHGRAALDRLRKASYDIILMDCQMPIMDGYEATIAIRGMRDGTERIPIIAVTAHAMVGDREKCLEAGMDGHVPKPVSVETLLDEMARVAPHLMARIGSRSRRRAA
jgi:ligand-binding sensor domain-containing protein/ActR/RegA family two-component response regulator